LTGENGYEEKMTQDGYGDWYCGPDIGTEIPLSEPIIDMQWDNSRLSRIGFAPELWDLDEYELMAELAMVCRSILTEADKIREEGKE